MKGERQMIYKNIIFMGRLLPKYLDLPGPTIRAFWDLK